VYGFPERYHDAIVTAQLVANPGCYPTASLLAILPLVAKFGRRSLDSASNGRSDRDDIEIQQIVIDAKSGITGAGRTPAVGSLFAEVYGDIRAYGLDGHRHEPEIAQEIQAAGSNAPFIFTPHVVPIARGMLVDAYILCHPERSVQSTRSRGTGSELSIDSHAAKTLYQTTYVNNPFVRVLPEDRAPSVAAVVGTNDAEIHVSVRGNVVRVLCAIDNLGKGAAGQAVQNLNIMCGFPEETGLYERVVV
jgi:N-acetyl-gamma-glutamyl-phosphate reductase